MCEIFDMFSRSKENISISLDEFFRHGVSTSDNKDGWEIAFHEGGDVHLLHEN